MRGAIALNHSPGPGDFAALTRALLLTKGHPIEAGAIAGVFSDRVGRILEKTATGALTLADSRSALGDSDLATITAAFIASLANAGAFDKMLADNAFVRTPLRSRLIATTAALDAASVAEGHAKPLTLTSFSGDVLTPQKAHALLVVTQELLRAGGPKLESFLTRELQSAVITGTDAVFVTGLIDAVSTAGDIPSTGSTFADIARDVGALLTAINTGTNSRPYILISPGTAKRLMTLATVSGGLAFPGMTLRGGNVCNVPAVATAALADSVVLIADASQIAADSAEITLNSSDSASFEMADNPAADVVSPTEPTTKLVNLFQTDGSALLVERTFGFNILRTDVVAALSDAAWGVETESGA